MQKLPSKSSYFLPFSFAVEFANNGFNLGGGVGEKNSGEGRQIRPAELCKQPEF